ncbi:hypothetical protein TD95_003236 [Thielaviopsis punctulata]|uniref:LCCL domain-containing protein n=1 Tax=Thielaviopsis punctulata TaxID=72032 RepID=A0A0F4ZBC5_9PEZI|nr:hypothetical protein TD95_003236 [Thielaviopsis punctulata]
MDTSNDHPPGPSQVPSPEISSSPAPLSGTPDITKPTPASGSSVSIRAATLEVLDSDDATISLPTTAPDINPPTPRFLMMQKKPKWVPYSVFRIWTAASRWAHGPSPPKNYAIIPYFAVVQEFPLHLVKKLLPRRNQRISVLIFVLLAWAVTFAMVKRHEMFSTDIAGWGDPQTIGCGVSYWARGNQCGLNGANCRPFNNTGFPFRCPADCLGYHVLNPRAVGDQEIVYRPLVIGGPSADDAQAVYRGDSFICGAALHAGVVSNSKGGCGVVKLVGQRSSYTSSKRNGIQSVGFDSDFPLSYTFLDVKCSSKDMRWTLLGISIAYSVIISLLTEDPAVFFFTTFVGLYWHVGMASDPPSHYSIPDLVSKLTAKFLPAMFVAWAFYDKMGVKRTLSGLTAQIEKTVLWMGACWVGALENYTLEWIPISRLEAHDLAQQPGAQATLAIIIVLIVAIAAGQIYCFRNEGRLIKYLQLYGLYIAGILILLVLPGLNLRIHHYILAILLIAGTNIRTRPSLLYQGLLVGLFINGIARWGFDSVLQTPMALQGDAQHNSLLPTILTPDIVSAAATNVSTITFKWEAPPSDIYEGMSILVNDVERFRTFFDGGYDSQTQFTWERAAGTELNEYFRFAFIEGSSALDYTRAGVWTKAGTWTPMEAGPSRVVRKDVGEGHVQGL